MRVQNVEYPFHLYLMLNDPILFLQTHFIYAPFLLSIFKKKNKKICHMLLESNKKGSSIAVSVDVAVEVG